LVMRSLNKKCIKQCNEGRQSAYRQAQPLGRSSHFALGFQLMGPAQGSCCILNTVAIL
jgi:hypothetical protein